MVMLNEVTFKSGKGGATYGSHKTSQRHHFWSTWKVNNAVSAYLSSILNLINVTCYTLVIALPY